VFLCLSTPSESQSCDYYCDGTGQTSCIYCVECGVCSSVGVIDHCFGAGVAHLSISQAPQPSTGTVLDMLKQYDVKASFWLIGRNVLSNVDVVNRMIAEGHYIGSNSWDYGHPNSGTTGQLAGELDQTQAVIQQTTGLTVTDYRPPYGELNTPQRTYAQSQGYQPVLWNLDVQDWRTDSAYDQTALRAIVDNMMVGRNPLYTSYVVVMTLNSQLGLDNLEYVIARVRGAGYRFVTFADCVNASFTPVLNSTTVCKHIPLSCVLPSGCGPTAECCDGSCCSSQGYCGTGPDWCGDGCQNGACTSPNCAFTPNPFTYTAVPSSTSSVSIHLQGFVAIIVLVTLAIGL